MKVLLSWLREFAPFGDDAAALGDQLSDLGLTVEEMTVVGEGLEGIVVARVLETRPHPDADRIQLVDVDLGDGEALQICCGAFNMAAGDLVPLATLGTTMTNGMTIERRKMRGEWSNGMLCAADEIGMGTDHDGIMILDPTVEVGAEFAGAMGIEVDVLYDLEVNPNRPDAMSVAGVARDLAARVGVPFAIPEPEVDEVGTLHGRAGIEIVDADLCGRFLVRVLDGVSVGVSPAWLAHRLRSLGMRPINSVVDVSNYVMAELGQPNHTYDLALVPDGLLRARWAAEGEVIETLDGESRALTATDGVIANRDDEVIGIAGVMGGSSTEISGSTSSVLVEMAWWDPMSIARTSSRLGLRSEASMRFERGADPEVVDLAARRFAQLLAETGATLVGDQLDERGDLPARSPIRVRTARVNDLLGTSLSPTDIADLLEPIGFSTSPVEGDHDVVIPSFRFDSVTEIDIIEEVARHHGYANIARTVPKALAGRLSERQQERRQLRQVLLGLGVTEAMPMPFLAPGDLERAGAPAEAVTLSNPLDANESVLRTSLRVGLLKALAFNASHRQKGVRLFEMGKVYLPLGAGSLPSEPEHLAVALAGSDATDAVEVWEVIRESLDCGRGRLVPVEVAGLHPSRTVSVSLGGRVIGFVGEIDPSVLADFGIDERVAWVELDLDALLAQPHGRHRYRPVSRQPSSDIDLAFEVASDVAAGTVSSTIRQASQPLLASLDLFDVYRGDGVAEGARSLAYRLRFQAPDRTLTDDDVADVRQKVIEAVAKAHDARLRG